MKAPLEMRAIKYIGFGIFFVIFIISSYLTSEEIKIWVYGETIESEIVYLSKLEDDKYKLVFKLNENATERCLIISKKAYNIIREDQVFRVKYLSDTELIYLDLKSRNQVIGLILATLIFGLLSYRILTQNIFTRNS